MATPDHLSSVKDSTSDKAADHYRLVAKNYDYFYKAIHDNSFAMLLKYFDVQPDHIVVDLGSGTGCLAERLFEKVQLRNPVWCVDPSAEMQEQAQNKKGVFPIQKTADKFFSDLDKEQRFDRVMCVASVHHFPDPVKIFRSVEASLSPGGVFLVTQGGKSLYSPLFEKARKLVGTCLSELKENTSLWLQSTNFDVEVVEEKFHYSRRKSKWYEMLRGRYFSTLRELSDAEIEEGINELENGELKDVKLHDEIRFSSITDVFIARKKTNAPSKPVDD